MQRWSVLVGALAVSVAVAAAQEVSQCGALAANKVPSTHTLVTCFTYKAVVPELPEGTKALDLWLPLPSDSKWQTVWEVTVESTAPYRITQEPKFGNRMVYVRVDNPKAPLKVTVRVVVERREVRVLAERTKGKGNTCPAQCNCAHCRAEEALRQQALQPEKMVPVGGRFLTIAKEVTQGKETTLDKIRALFEHVVVTMQYDYKRESPKLGEGDVLFVCDFRKGNCSDLHSYLISLARSLGIPAYLEFGFPIAGIPLPDSLPKEGKIGGYHCWTWVYDEQLGWFPLDASDARRWLDAGKPEVKEFLFGNLLLERSAVAVSRGRDIVLNPPQKGAPLNYFIYPYAEADGQSVKVNWELSYRLLE